MPRRIFFSAAVVARALQTFAGFAQTWPIRSGRIVVPAASEGSADPLARLAAEKLSRAPDQFFVVESRLGASGNVGAASAEKSVPDGHIIPFGWTDTLVPAITLYDAKPYHLQRDLEPIVLVGSVPNVVAVQPSLGARPLRN